MVFRDYDIPRNCTYAIDTSRKSEDGGDWVVAFLCEEDRACWVSLDCVHRERVERGNYRDRDEAFEAARCRCLSR